MQHTHSTMRKIAVSATMLLVATLIAVTMSTASAQTNPLPGVWYGAYTGGPDVGSNVVTFVFDEGPSSSMSFMIVDYYDNRCPEWPEFLVGTAGFVGSGQSEVEFRDPVRYCSDGTVFEETTFVISYNAELAQFDGELNGVGIAFQRVCPRHPDFFNDYLDPCLLYTSPSPLDQLPKLERRLKQ